MAFHEHYRKKPHRIVIDTVVLLFFLFAIGGIVVSNILRVEQHTQKDAASSNLRTQETASSQHSANTDTGDTLSAVGGNRESTDTDTLNEESVINEPLITPDVDTTLQGENESAATPTESVQFPSHSPMKFSDVTSVRYENKRLGFIMELPDNWPMVYERSNEVAFASKAQAYGATLEAVQKGADVMWISIGRTCESSPATSTPFTAISSTTLERYACVPPFALVLGLRSDTPYTQERERFLLDIARTLYPIVSNASIR